MKEHVAFILTKFPLPKDAWFGWNWHSSSGVEVKHVKKFTDRQTDGETKKLTDGCRRKLKSPQMKPVRD